MRWRLGMCSSFQMPRSPGVMRPSGVTAEASRMTRLLLPGRGRRDELDANRWQTVLGGVFAHGGDADAIGEGEGAELERSKKDDDSWTLDERERLGCKTQLSVVSYQLSRYLRSEREMSVVTAF